MKPFRIHTGIVAPLYRANIDTDQIIPKQFLKRVERTGFGEFLFHDWRRSSDGQIDPTFVLNDPRYADAGVLLAGKNFGCGSSREHAVWALEDFGFRAVIAPSFADIFANNCMKNGVLTVTLEESQCENLVLNAEKTNGYGITIDLAGRKLSDAHGLHIPFPIEDFRRHCLLEGLDEISLTLQHEADITAYEGRQN